jgi:hypothetical protein
VPVHGVLKLLAQQRCVGRVLRPDLQQIRAKHFRIPVPAIAAAPHPKESTIDYCAFDLAHCGGSVAVINTHDMSDGHDRRDSFPDIRQVRSPLALRENRRGEDRCGRSVVSGATLSAATAILRGSRDRYDVQAIHDPECSKPIRAFARSIANNGRDREPTILFAHLRSA